MIKPVTSQKIIKHNEMFKQCYTGAHLSDHVRVDFQQVDFYMFPKLMAKIQNERVIKSEIPVRNITIPSLVPS